MLSPTLEDLSLHTKPLREGQTFSFKAKEHILGGSRQILDAPFSTKGAGARATIYWGKKKFSASMKSSVLFTVGGCYPKKSPDTGEQNIKFINNFKSNRRD